MTTNKTDLKDLIKNELLQLQDDNYRFFMVQQITTTPPERILGVTVPELKKLAVKIAGSESVNTFLDDLPHDYYEEDLLHILLLEHETDFDKYLERLNEFLPFVDNWSTCDFIRPKILSTNKEKFIEQIEIWLQSEETYIIRFAILCLMNYFLGGNFSEKYIDYVCDIKSEEHYVKMAIAWYMSTALAFQYNSAIKVLWDKRLDKWTHNKIITKAVEGKRFSETKKAYLRSLRIRRREIEYVKDQEPDQDI